MVSHTDFLNTRGKKEKRLSSISPSHTQKYTHTLLAASLQFHSDKSELSTTNTFHNLTYQENSTATETVFHHAN